MPIALLRLNLPTLAQAPGLGEAAGPRIALQALFHLHLEKKKFPRPPSPFPSPELSFCELGKLIPTKSAGLVGAKAGVVKPKFAASLSLVEPL